jgi:hypothetical protein
VASISSNTLFFASSAGKLLSIFGLYLEPIMTSSFRNALGATLLGLAAVITAPTATAAIVTGSWDPALPDPPFRNIGWTTTINLQTSCTQGGGNGSGNVVNIFGGNFNCNGNQSVFTFLSAQIGFYDLTSGILVEVLTLTPSTFTPSQLVLTPNQISQLRSSTDSNAVAGGLDDRGTSGFQFKLGLPGQAPVIMYAALGSSDFITAPGSAIQTGFAVRPDEMRDQILLSTTLMVGQAVVLAQIPEPGSLALALLALGAAGAAVSRRSRRSDSQAAVTA